MYHHVQMHTNVDRMCIFPTLWGCGAIFSLHVKTLAIFPTSQGGSSNLAHSSSKLTPGVWDRGIQGQHVPSRHVKNCRKHVVLHCTLYSKTGVYHFRCIYISYIYIIYIHIHVCSMESAKQVEQPRAAVESWRIQLGASNRIH